MRLLSLVSPVAIGAAFAVASAGCKKDEAQPVPLPEAEKVSKAAPLEASAADAEPPTRRLAEAGKPSTPAPRERAQRKPSARPSRPAAASAPASAPEAADPTLPPGAVVVEQPIAALGLQPPSGAGVADRGAVAEPDPSAPTAMAENGGAVVPSAAGRPGGRYSAADLKPLGAPRAPPSTPPGAEPTFDEGVDAPQPPARPVRPTMGRPNPGRPGPNLALPPPEVGVDVGAQPPQPHLGRPTRELPAAPDPAAVPSAIEPAMPGEAPSLAIRPTLPTQSKPNAAIYLREDDVFEALGAKRPLDVHELPGMAGDDRYDSLYFGSPDGSQYYAGLQIWRPRSPIDAQRRYTQMVRSYPNAEETTAVGSKTFFAFWNDLYYLVFLLSDNAAPTVVALTCDQRTCDSPQELVTLASKIYDRLNAKEPPP